MKKLAIVASEFPPAPGGMQQHALGVAEGLTRFYEVIVLTAARHREHRYDSAFEVRPVLHKTRNPDFDVIRATEADVTLTLNAGYAPLSCHTRTPVFCYCHGNDYLNPWIDSTSAPVARLLKKLEKKLRKVPNLAQHPHNFRRAIVRRNMDRGLQRARAIFVNSRYTQARLCDTFPNCRTPIYVAHPGVPDFMLDSNKTARLHRRKNGPVRLLTIARLARNARKKNVDNILRALAKVKDDISFEYRILGDGDLRSELERLAAELGISAQTQFLGAVPNKDIPAWLDETDLFVLPSKASERDVESFGIVYVEAAARGVPSMASRAGGAVDAIADGVSGIILKGSEPDDIAAGIRKFVAEKHQFFPSNIVAFANSFRWERVAQFMYEKMEIHLN